MYAFYKSKPSLRKLSRLCYVNLGREHYIAARWRECRIITKIGIYDLIRPIFETFFFQD